MQESTCVNCQTPKSQWKERDGQGYTIEDQLYCSKNCSQGSIDLLTVTAPTLRRNDQPLQSAESVAETDPHLLRAQLNDAEARLGFVLESIKDCALLLLDVNGRITGWSAGAENILGYTENEILGQPIQKIFTPEDNAAGIAEGELALSRSEGRATDNRWHVCKDGSLFWAAGYMRPLFSFEADKQLRGYAKLVRDLTEMKQTESRMAELNAALETRVAERTHELNAAIKDLRREIDQRQAAEAHLLETNKFEAIGRLAGGVAHDFNNLLTGIVGIAAALSEETKDSNTRGELGEILKAAQKATELTRQLLAIGRQQVVSLQIINPNGLVVEALPFYKRLLREDIELITRLDPSLGNIKANKAQIQQVLNNLLLNAQDAMPSGGKLEIHTANVMLDARYVPGHFAVKPGSYVELSIVDHGHGMDQKTLVHIFEPFFTTKEAGRGSGLGLAAVYGIVAQNGGDIEVTSQPQQGTTVRIVLPQVAAEASREQHHQESPGSSSPSRGEETILIVDDDPLVRRITARGLEKRGYRVRQAASGQEALALASQHNDPIALMLTDVVMPGMNGRELAEKLAIQQPDLAVLYTSGHTVDIVLGRGIENSSIDFIEKPFSVETLASRIRKALDARPPARR